MVGSYTGSSNIIKKGGKKDGVYRLWRGNRPKKGQLNELKGYHRGQMHRVPGRRRKGRSQALTPEISDFAPSHRRQSSRPDGHPHQLNITILGQMATQPRVALFLLKKANT
jgi:hypothetical protein